MKSTFTSYFQFSIAYAFKTILTMCNDLSWRNTGNNAQDCFYMVGLSSGREIYGMRIARIVHHTRKLLLPVLGKIELNVFVSVLDKMTVFGDLEIYDPTDGMGKVYHLSIAEIKHTIEHRS